MGRVPSVPEFFPILICAVRWGMRWWTLKAAGALQGFYAAILVAFSTYCFVLAHTAARSGNKKHAAGLYTGGWTIALLGITYIVGTFGLWQHRKWAWWLCVMASVVPAVLILLSIVSGDDDPDDWGAIVFFAIPTVSLLLARVRPTASH